MEDIFLERPNMPHDLRNNDGLLVPREIQLLMV